ncbi:MAG: iron-sulfur cluster assembly scaffold protein [Candidatus Ozemobacteraceae bacterium]
MYNEKVIEHFMNPRHVGVLDPCDGGGRIGDPDCGDFLEVTLRLSDESEVITDIAFRVKGCPAAIATSSIMAEMVFGGAVDKALQMSDQDIVDALGGLPEAKVHCSLLAVRGLHLALQNAIYKRLFVKSGIVTSPEEFDQKYAAGELSHYFHTCDGSCEAPNPEKG